MSQLYWGFKTRRWLSSCTGGSKLARGSKLTGGSAADSAIGLRMSIVLSSDVITILRGLIAVVEKLEVRQS